MAAIYRHTQVGRITIVVFGIAFAAALSWSAVTPHPALIAATVIAGLLLGLFSTLTVAVRDEVVEVFFGPGLIRRRIPLRRIREVQAIHTPWYYGWGIRLTPSGWLWRVSGLRGVELLFTDGSRFRVGSDDADRLAEVLRRQAAG